MIPPQLGLEDPHPGPLPPQTEGEGAGVDVPLVSASSVLNRFLTEKGMTRRGSVELRRSGDNAGLVRFHGGLDFSEDVGMFGGDVALL